MAAGLLGVVVASLGSLAQPRPAVAAQSIPYKINFQGRLTDNAGNIMPDGQYNIKFRIFDAASGGTNVWQEDWTRGASDRRVTVENGLFNIQFGTYTALSPSLFSGAFPLYLEVELPTPASATCATNGCAVFTEGPMTPRQALASSAYAFNSDTLDGLDSDAFAQLTADNTFSGVNLFAPTGAGDVALTVKASTAGSTNALEVFDSANVRQAYFDANGNFNVARTIQATSNNAIDLGTSGNAFRTGYFATSVVSPSFTGSGAVGLSSGGSGDLTLTSASGTIVVSAGTLRRNSTGFSVDLATTATSTLTITNSDGSNVANLAVEGGVSIGAGQTYKVNGTQISSADLSNDANITKQGNTFNGASQLVQLNGSGALPALSGANLTSLDASNLATGSGAVTLQSAAASGLTLTAGNGTIVLGSGTVQRSGSSLAFDVAGAATSTFTVTNSDGSNVANLSVEGSVNAQTGSLQTAGTTRIDNGGALVNINGATFASGNLNVGAGTITSGAINGQTISSAANFTGTVSVASTINGQTISNAASFTGTLATGGAITAPTSTNTINGLVINSGALSAVSGITFASGNLNVGAGTITSGTINGQTISNAASFTGTLSVAGAITAPTTTNTINGAIINSGALSGINGITFNSGNLNVGSGTITSGNINGQTISSAANFTGTATFAGAITAPTSTNTINGLVINGGALSNVNGITFASGNLNLGSGTITSGDINGQTISSAANFTGSLTTAGLLTTNGSLAVTAASPGDVAAQLQGAANATQPVLLVKGGATPGLGADLLQFQDSNGALMGWVDSSGSLSLGVIDREQDADPTAKLEVVGSISHSLANNDIRTYHDVVGYEGSINTTGTMRITMPKGWSATMMRMTIKGYDWTPNTGAWEVVVSGLNYNAPNAWWYPSAEIRGKAPFSSVRLGYDGSNMVVLLGTTTTVWQYPKITVDEFTAGFGGVMGWGSGWTIAPDTTETGISSIVTATVPYYSSSTNAGGATQLNFSGTTSNTLVWNAAGVAAPTFGTRSVGTKLVLYPAIGPAIADGALGIEANAMWFSTFTNSATHSFRFYGGTTEVVRIQGNGNVGFGTTGPDSKIHVVGGGICVEASESTCAAASGTLEVSNGVNIGAGQTYKVGGSQISSANLSNDANLAKLDGTQTFTGTNTFQPTTNIPSVVIKQTSAGSPTADIFNLQTANGTTIIQATGPAVNESDVTVQSVGAGRVLTLNSSSGTIALGSATTTIQKAATGLTLDVSSLSSSTLTITNSDANAVASLSVEGGITASGSHFLVNTDGDIRGTFRQTADPTTTVGSGTNATVMTLTNAANFTAGSYILLNNPAGCVPSGTLVTQCYAKIISKVGSNITISPALSWANGNSVTEYYVPEIGGTNLVNPATNRYGRGYFLAGIATGNGNTLYGDGSIESVYSTFSIANTTVTTLNVGGAATAINLGSSTALLKVATTASATLANANLLVTNSEVSGTLRIGNASDRVELTASGLLYTGNARPQKQIVLSPEYAGATFSVDDAVSNTTGTLTSDNAGSGSSWRNFYQWSSTLATTQQYSILVRVPLPADFGAWESTPFTVAYRTGVAGTTNNYVQVRVSTESGTAVCDTGSQSSTIWAVTPSTSCSFTNFTNNWSTHGQIAVIRIKLGANSTASALAQVGDIVLNYRARF